MSKPINSTHFSITWFYLNSLLLQLLVKHALKSHTTSDYCSNSANSVYCWDEVTHVMTKEMKEQGFFSEEKYFWRLDIT